MYAELHALTNFTFLEGASHPDELVARAAELGYAALAITDRQSLAGVVRAHRAAKEAGLKLLIGAEIYPRDAWPAVLLATDRAAYGRLARLLTVGCRRAAKGACELHWDDVAAHADGLLACVLAAPDPLFDPSDRKAGTHGDGNTPSRRCAESPRRPADGGEISDAELARYRDVFGDRCYLLAELHYGPIDARRLARWIDLARRQRVPLAAGGGVCYHAAQRQPLHDVLRAIRRGTVVGDPRAALHPNAERHLKSPQQMAALFAAAPRAVAVAAEAAERCRFSLDELRYEYPEELAPPGRTPLEYLTELTWAGARQRWPEGVPPRVCGLLEHELQLIGQLRYEAYFLTVWDLVQFARRRGILCQGRGSAANSAVCYCLGITAVDPSRMDLLFERFISRERAEAPDIDVDFEHRRREEVLQYIYEKYGRERSGMTAEVICYRPRSAVRDVGKALGLSLDRVDALCAKLEHYRHADDLPDRCREAGIDPDGILGRRLVALVRQLIGFPRHLSQHTGGMVITRGPLCELVPIENAAMPGRTVIQWDKNDLDELGILKVDCLALGMLSALSKCFQLIERHDGVRLSPADIPEGDEPTYDMICRADTIGVFQIESRAQMSMLPRLRPRNFYDLVIEVAIVRPGPIQGQMVHPYLRRRSGEETPAYPNDAIRNVLEKTLGVPLFQEQAMRLAIVAAGFTPGEADRLRRAFGAWRRPGVIDEFRAKLIEGMTARGYSPQFAQTLFEQIRGFGDYGFPESHAASFALLVYVSAWLKRHYPAAFFCALLNSQPMGFYAPAQLVRDAQRHGVEVRPADVNFSRWDCTLEPGEAGGAAARSSRTLPRAEGESPAVERSRWALRLGLSLVKHLSAADAEALVAARKAGPFRSLDELARRSGLPRAVLMRLAEGGVCASLRPDRRGALWDALLPAEEPLPLFARSVEPTELLSPDVRPETNPAEAAPLVSTPPVSTLPSPQSPVSSQFSLSPQLPAAPLPPMSEAAEVLADYRTQSLSLRGHPMKFLRPSLGRRGVLSAAELAAVENGRRAAVAGIVLVRQRPGTAKGITFFTLEDESGSANLIVRPHVWRRCRAAARNAVVLLAAGRVQRQGEVIHLLATHLEDLSAQMTGLETCSRDFC